MWSIKNYITIISFTILFSVIIFLYLQNRSYKCENKRLQREAIQYEQTLNIQNEEIKRKELDLENFKKQKPKIEKEIITKYEYIIKPQKEKDYTCENELNNIKKLLETFDKCKRD